MAADDTSVGSTPCSMKRAADIFPSPLNPMTDLADQPEREPAYGAMASYLKNSGALSHLEYDHRLPKWNLSLARQTRHPRIERDTLTPITKSDIS
jgi:hypothetical protein